MVCPCLGMEETRTTLKDVTGAMEVLVMTLTYGIQLQSCKVTGTLILATLRCNRASKFYAYMTSRSQRVE